MTITKKEITESLAQTTGLKKNLISKAVDALFEKMTAELMAGNRIEIRGLGVWEVKNTNPRPNARNPKTGEPVYVPARRKVHFKPGMRLKEGLRKPV